MPLRFFADHCVPNAVAETLEGEGHEVLRLRNHLPTDAPDEVVIATAQERGCILVSLNGDFSDIVSYPPANYGGIIALQVRNRPEAIPRILARLSVYLFGHREAGDYTGKLLLVEAHRIRVRG